MDDQEDPALQFFPDGKVDLYATLNVDRDASADAIKKAYKKLALKFHPDKVLSQSSGASSSKSSSNSSSSKSGSEEAIRQFQKIGFAYAVLSDEVRRKKYDATGSTRELGIGEGVEDFDWNEYFKTLWTGEVSRKTLDEFKLKYQNSQEEKQDIIAAYESSEGSLEAIFAAVPCCEFSADEERFMGIVNEAIESGEIKATKTWKASSTAAARAALRKKAKSEAAQAEKLAHELGVYDDLFGSGKPKAKAKAKAQGKTKSQSQYEEEDLSALQALMQRKQADRANAFDDMIAKMEAKHGGKSETRPSDDEFHRLQASMLADRDRRKAASSSGPDSSVPPQKKRAKTRK